MVKNIILAALTMMCVSCAQEKNPLLEDWSSTEGIPPFGRIENRHYLPAFEKAMSIHSEEIKAIAGQKDTPDFENTVAAFDRSGSLLMSVSLVFENECSINSSDELNAIAEKVSEMRTAHYNAVYTDSLLFSRVKYVYDSRDSMGLDEEQSTLLENVYRDFMLSGAGLDFEGKKALAQLDSRIGTLELKFMQNLVKETGSYRLEVDDVSKLAGLSESQLASAASRAEAAGLAGTWVFGLDNPSVMPFLSSASDRDLRSEIFNAYISRCANGNECDNREIVKELLDLRIRKAHLLGYATFADYVLTERMARSATDVYDILDRIWKPALAAAGRELEDIRKEASSEGIGGEIKGSDWRYFFEKAKKRKFSVSDEELMPYLEIGNVRKGIFTLVEKLYGVRFRALEGVPVPHPEATAYECLDSDGSRLGILFMDMFARPGQKSGGAWCSSYRDAYRKDGERVYPIVTIVGNFSRPVSDTLPALLTPDETETFFHEFGHAMAGLLADVNYVSLCNMKRDFVELPSQIMEHWAFEPELLDLYAKHHVTGETIPAELVERMKSAGKYGQGFATTEFVAAAYLDMDYHVLESMPEDMDVMAFEKKMLAERGLLDQIPPRYRTTYFAHVFGGGYTAGYYSYIWAEVFDCDAYSAFVESGDIFSKEVAARFRKEILEKAGSGDPMSNYLAFRGRKPSVEGILSNRGL